MLTRTWMSVLVTGLAVWPAMAVVAQDVAIQNDGGEITLRVSHRARALHPGEVVLIVVKAYRPLLGVEGDAFDRPIRFWSTEDSREWQALIGIALDTKPGKYDVLVRATAAGDLTATGRMSLTVRAKRFATRQLRLSDRFVNPPADAGERIAQETQLVASIFEQSRPDRIWHGTFVPPVPGPPTSSFGRLSTLNGQPRGRHQGTDFRAPEGMPVLAPNAGEVMLAADLYFSGNTVILDHGSGLFSLFAHLSRMAVAVGDRVSRGDRLGESGATGRVTGPHLHWAVRLGNLSVDPLSLMVAVGE